MTNKEIRQEITRVEKAMTETKSFYLYNDYKKYLKRLKRELYKNVKIQNTAAASK